MNRTTDTTAYQRNHRTILPIELGGTGVNTASEVVLTLGAIDLNELAQPIGIASLNSNGVIPDAQLPIKPGIEAPSLDGPSVVYNLDTVTYEITNYDSLRAYVISAKKGSITRNGKILTYTAPATVDADIIKINDKSVAIAVVQSSINKPSIVSPLPNSAGSSPLTITASIFACLGYTPSSYTLVCEIATDVNFTNIVNTVSGITIDHLSANLPNNSLYYIRVKYQSSGFVDSPWSDVISIGPFVNLPIHEYQTLSPSDFSTSGSFGVCLAISDDNSRLFIGASESSVSSVTQAGAVYVYLKDTNGLYQFEARLNSPTPTNYHHFGADIAINSDASVLVVGEQYGGSGGNGLFIFKRIGTTWSYVCPVNFTSWFTDQTVVIRGNKIFVPHYDNQNVRTIQIYNFDGVSVSLEHTLYPTNAINNSAVFNSLSVSDDGNTFAIGLDHDGVNQSGKVYIWHFDSNTWIQTAELYPDEPSIENWGQCFGTVSKLNDAGDMIIIGDLYSNLGNPKVDNIYIFALENGTWIRKSKFSPTDWSNDVNGTLSGINEFSFDLSGKFVLAGSPYSKLLADGAAYLFSIQNGVLTQEYEYLNTGQHWKWFGQSVALSKDFTLAIVGMDPHGIGGYVTIYN